MHECKRCESKIIVKSGIVREKQRWLCKECGYNFTEGDGRKQTSEAKKALAVLLVCLGLSFRASGLVVKVGRSTVLRWFRTFAETLQLPAIAGNLDVVELDEMWHFLQKKKTSSGSGKPQRQLLVQLDSSMLKWGIATVKL
jgi:transposase